MQETQTETQPISNYADEIRIGTLKRPVSDTENVYFLCFWGCGMQLQLPVSETIYNHFQLLTDK